MSIEPLDVQRKNTTQQAAIAGGGCTVPLMALNKPCWGGCAVRHRCDDCKRSIVCTDITAVHSQAPVSILKALKKLLCAALSGSLYGHKSFLLFQFHY